jgi:hypothetical protein
MLTENSIEAYDRWLILDFVGGMKRVEKELERIEAMAGLQRPAVSALMEGGTSLYVFSFFNSRSGFRCKKTH